MDNYMEKWNPLEIISMNAEENYRQLAISSTKQQIRNILKSYVGYYDPFCELLQNAMDATDRMAHIVGNEYRKRIKIYIDLSENSIYVADNGIVFETEQFRAFLSPNVSYKTDGHTRGNKGVGTTYLAYGFCKMQMYTKTLSFKQYAEINNAKKWIDDKTGDVDMPFVECRDGEDEEFPFNQGTSFKLFFKDENGNKIKDLSWLGINTAESWNYVLLTNTPLGHLTIDGSDSKVTYDLCVKDIKGKITRIENRRAEFFYPHMFMKHTSINIEDVIAWQKAEIEKGRDGTNIPQRFNKKLGLYRFFQTNDIIKLAERSKTLSSDEIQMLDDYNIIAYGFFCNSVDDGQILMKNLLKPEKEQIA